MSSSMYFIRGGKMKEKKNAVSLAHQRAKKTSSHQPPGARSCDCTQLMANISCRSSLQFPSLFAIKVCRLLGSAQRSHPLREREIECERLAATIDLFIQ